VTLHLVRIGVDLHALARFAAARRLSDDDYGYALHAALAARFGPDAAPRPFRFLPDHRAGPHLLGYTADPAPLLDATALPVIDDLIDGIFSDPKAQAMPATWRAGARYDFEVRVRPVVRFGKTVRAARGDRAGAWQRGASEMDAYVTACERAVAAGGSTTDIDREAVYLDWLTRRLAAAATIDTATLRAFQRSHARRGTHSAGDSSARTRTVEGPDATLGGTLTVTDSDAFASLLARGIGRHAAFGYGMLLLSPPGRSG